MFIRTFEAGPNISDLDVARFERERGIRLPASYRRFLVESNGGRPERDLFAVEGFVASPVARIHFFFGIGDAVESCDLGWNANVFADRIRRDCLPVGTTEGADKICLMVDGQDSGAIFYWDAVGTGFHRVAPDFATFLCQLFRDEDSPTPDDE